MKRFPVVSIAGFSGIWRIGIIRSFLPFPVRANTICGHVGAELALIPFMWMLLTGGRVRVYETGFCEL